MKIDCYNKKLIRIASEFYGLEILLNNSWFLGKNNKRLFKGLVEHGNKGGFKVWWNTKNLKYFRYWIEDINFKDIEQNLWNSFDYKSNCHLCEYSYGKYSERFKNKKDHNNGITLSNGLTAEQEVEIKDFEGIDHIENNVDSAYRGMLPDRIRFFYKDFTYDFFDREYYSKRNKSFYFYNYTIGHYTLYIKKDLKDGQIDVKYYANFPKKYKMRYKTKKTIKKMYLN